LDIEARYVLEALARERVRNTRAEDVREPHVDAVRVVEVEAAVERYVPYR
jgi:hypothetical protein